MKCTTGLQRSRETPYSEHCAQKGKSALAREKRHGKWGSPVVVQVYLDKIESMMKCEAIVMCVVPTELLNVFVNIRQKLIYNGVELALVDYEEDSCGV